MRGSTAERFAKAFAGLPRSSGRYVVPNGARADAKGKVLGRAWTAHDPITAELWEAHLSGKQITVKDERTDEPITGALGLGVVPIRDDGTVVFGAIDVDQYDPPVDWPAFLAEVAHLRLPVIPCRSKSGAPHVYLFLSSPAPAALVRDKLAEWAVALGFPGVEVFPKQTALTKHSEGDWINLPYSGGNRSLRYALRPDGSAMTVEEFLDAVDVASVAPEELEAFELPADERDEAFEESPPCLAALAKKGFGDWGNNGLFNVAIYLKKRFGEGWEEHLEAYNARLEGLGLGARDVATIAKSVKKKDYFYKCKDQPIVSVCDKTVCLKRAFGIGGGSADPGVLLGGLVKVTTDPVTWVLSVDGAEVELTTEQLMDQRRFSVAMIEKLSKWPAPVKPKEWSKLVRERLAKAKVVEVPKDATREGQFWEHLGAFCTGRAPAKALDGILMGKAFTDEAAGRAYFRSTDFFAYLSAHRFSGMTERDAWRWLRNRGGETHDARIKGKPTTYWSVPAFAKQTEEHEVPRKKMVEM